MSSYLPTLESFAKGVLGTTAGVTTIGMGLLYYGQSYLIYPSAFPPGARTDVPVPTDFGMQYENLELRTPDGVTLRCYMLVQKKEPVGLRNFTPLQTDESMSDDEFAAGRPTVMMFHGNGGNAGHRIPLARVFYASMRCNVLMLEYRGYGHSDGSPSEKGIRIDAQTGLDYLTSHPSLNRTPIFLYGQSIGGAVAIDLASRNPSTIHGLILENTFLSIPRLIPTALPLLSPFSFLCHQKWDSASKIPLIPASTPMLLLSGSRDEVVPAEHMTGLWELAKRDGKARTPESKIMVFAEGTHNDTCVQMGYWNAVAEFVGTVSKKIQASL